MKVSVDLPPALIRVVKLTAAEEGKKLKVAFAELIQAGLRQPAINEIDAPRRGFIALPLFPVDGPAPADHMTLAELGALEQEALIESDLERVRPSPR
jgi:hypothetical protein